MRNATNGVTMKHVRSGYEAFSNRGFTLIEIVVVVGILVILLAIGGFQMTSWMSKARVEEETKQMYADLTNARTGAMNRSRMHFVRMSQSQYVIWEDTSPGPDGNGTLETGSDRQVLQVNLKDRLLSAPTFTAMSFDPKGIILGAGTIQIQNAYGSMYDCITISSTRIRLGRMQGGNCS